MSTTWFVHALQRCTGRACMSFLLILQEVRPIGKTRNQLHFIVVHPELRFAFFKALLDGPT